MNNYTGQSQVLASALIKAVDKLGISSHSLENIIGVNLQHERILLPDSTQAEHAKLLIRLCIALDRLCEGDVNLMQRYIHSHNKLTGGVPENQIKSRKGLDMALNTVESLLHN
jgi:hypothetical protein